VDFFFIGIVYVTGLLECKVGLVPDSTWFTVVIYRVLEVGFFCTRVLG